MRQSVTFKGMDRMVRKLKRHPELIARGVESVLVQEARALCVEYGSATLPGPGFGDEKAKKFEKRVEGDVRRVFATRDRPNAVYAMLKQRDPAKAAAYWHAYKSGKTRAMADIVRRADLPQGLNPAHHKAARTGKAGRVSAMPVPASLATTGQLNAYVRKQKKLVGFAKAGWYAAARGLGGRVRRRTVSAQGRRSSEEIFPPYVRKLARRYPAAGGARMRSAGMNMRVEIFTRVKHARTALPDGLYQSVNGRAAERFGEALAKSMVAANRKTFGRTSYGKAA